MQPSFWITVLLSIVLAHSLPLNGVEASPAGNLPHRIAASQDPPSRRQLAGLPNPLLAGSPSPPVNSTSPPTPSSSSEPSSTSTSTSTPSSTETQTSPKRNVLKRANKPLPQQVAPPHTTLSRRQIENIKLAMNRAPRSPAPSARAIKESELKALVAPLAALANAVPSRPARGVTAVPSLPVTPPGAPHPARAVPGVPSLPVTPPSPPASPSAPSPRDVAAAPAPPVAPALPVTPPGAPHPARAVPGVPSLPVTPPSHPASPSAPSPRDVAAAPALPVAAPSPPSSSPRDVPAASSESVKTSAAPHALVGRELRAPDYNSAGPQADDSASGSEDAKAHAEEEATPANKKHDTHNAQEQAKERRYGGSPEWIADSDLGETSDESKRSADEHASAMVKGNAARLMVGRMEQMVKVQ